MGTQTKTRLHTYQELKQKVIDHINSYIVAGEALEQIRDDLFVEMVGIHTTLRSAKWREITGYKNLYDLTRGEFGFSKTITHQLITASQTYQNLSSWSAIGEPSLPRSERVIRPLTKLRTRGKLNAKLQCKVWEEVTRVYGNRPTASQVELVIHEFSEPPEKEEPTEEEIQDRFTDDARSGMVVVSKANRLVNKVEKQVDNLLSNKTSLGKNLATILDQKIIIDYRSLNFLAKSIGKLIIKLEKVRIQLITQDRKLEIITNNELSASYGENGQDYTRNP